MVMRGVDQNVEGAVVRRAVLVVAEPGTIVRAEAESVRERLASRGSVALFADSFGGMGAAVAKGLVRCGYAVRLYCRVKRDLAAGVVRDVEALGWRAAVQSDASDADHRTLPM
jgi:3-oxoacyl-[acyl-carrier protein] reductase